MNFNEKIFFFQRVWSSFYKLSWFLMMFFSIMIIFQRVKKKFESLCVMIRLESCQSENFNQVCCFFLVKGFI